MYIYFNYIILCSDYVVVYFTYLLQKTFEEELKVKLFLF